MNYVALKTEIDTGPLAAELAPHKLSGNDGAIAAALNDKRGATMLHPRLVTARTVLAEYPDGPMAGAAMLDKLEAVAVNVPAVKWVMGFMKADGIDIGSPATQAMLDQLAAGGLITVTEAGKLKSMGMAPASRAEVVFGVGTMVTPTDVSETRRV